MLHVLVHGLAKSSGFILAGRITNADGTTELGALRSLHVRRPSLANPFLAAMVALVGLPPFALFFTEVAIVLAGFQAGLGWVMILLALLLLLNFAGLIRHTASMVFGRPEIEPEVVRPIDHSWHGARIPIILALAVAIVLPFISGLGHVLTQIADVLKVIR